MIEQLLLLLPLIFGAYISLSVMKVPDLGIESAFVFGAVAAASLHSLGLPAPVMLVGSLAGGAAVGLVTGILNQVFRVPFLLGSILTNGLFHGIIQLSLGTALYSFSIDFGGVGMLIAVAVGLCGLLALFLRTQLGNALAAYGNNPKFLEHHTISTRFTVISGVAIANTLAGLGGFLFAQSNGFVDLSMGYGVVLTSITTLVLGRVFFRGENPHIGMPLLGIALFFAIQQLLLNVGFNLKYFNAFQAIFVLVALVGMRRKRAQLTIDHLGV